MQSHEIIPSVHWEISPFLKKKLISSLSKAYPGWQRGLMIQRHFQLAWFGK